MVDVSDPVSEEPQIPLTDAPKRTAESWAEAKGMLPEHFIVPASAGRFPVAPRYNPEFWRFKAAAALSKWPIGAEVTEAEFDAAVVAATTGISR